MMRVDSALRGALGTFVVEALEISEKISASVLALERGDVQGDEVERARADIKRGLHTLKGSASTFALHELSTLAHRLEDLVVAEPAGGEDARGQIADALLCGLDAFVAAVQALADDEDPGSLDEVIAQIEGLRDRCCDDAQDSEKSTRSDAACARATDVVTPSDPDTQPKGAPSTPARDSPESLGSWTMDESELQELTRQTDRLRQHQLRLRHRVAEVERAVQTLAPLRGDIAGDTRSLLTALRGTLAADTEEAEDILDSIQGSLRAVCMLPVQTIVPTLQRAVRDSCRKTGRMAQLSVVGAEISADGRVLRALSGPLLHLVRNAVVHGIESPDERDAAGKHAEGALTLRLEKQGNLLSLELADDGRGLDVASIGAAAVERGLASAAEVASMERAAVYNFIFQPGFSTARQTSDLAGRGIGLDVVQGQIRRLRGQIDVVSESGQGTSFLLTLTASLASSPTLLARVDDTTVGLPMAALDSIVGFTPELLTSSGRRALLRHRDHLIELKDLGAVLGMRQPAEPTKGEPIVVVRAQGSAVALLVDEVIGDADVSVHPMPRELRQIKAWQGAATLALGEPMPVLRPEFLVSAPMKVRAANTRRVLVVDDSLTARAIHRTILESAGYVVTAVSSAEDALDKLAKGSFDVIVCDICLGQMDGLTFTARVRDDERLGEIPVVLVSVRDDEATREHALGVGASAFISKRACESGLLLSRVESLLRGAAS